MCFVLCILVYFFFFFKQKTAYEMRISDWSSDVCSSDLFERVANFFGIWHETRRGNNLRSNACRSWRFDPFTWNCGGDSCTGNYRGIHEFYWKNGNYIMLINSSDVSADRVPPPQMIAGLTLLLCCLLCFFFSDRKSTRLNSSH